MCLSLLWYGGEAGFIAIFPLGIGGIISAALSLGIFFQGFVEEEGEKEYRRGYATLSESYQTAACCAPFGIVWLASVAYGIYENPHSDATWAYLFFLIPLWIIVSGCIAGLVGGMSHLLDKNAGPHAINIGVSCVFVAVIAYLFFYHEASGITAHRKLCEAKDERLEVRQNAISIGIGGNHHYACSGDSQPLYRR
jgi:hypothetical protein